VQVRPIPVLWYLSARILSANKLTSQSAILTNKFRVLDRATHCEPQRLRVERSSQGLPRVHICACRTSVNSRGCYQHHGHIRVRVTQRGENGFRFAPAFLV
jgi:hypothetical protein